MTRNRIGPSAFTWRMHARGCAAIHADSYHPESRVQMDPKFLRNLRFSKKWNGKGRGSDE